MDRCPNMVTIRGGDESMDFCKESDMRLCLLVSGMECKVWEEIKDEEDNIYWKERE
ncbi:hypothetical protein LCGC14_1460120 [marine sediment metagenome]|uniref:Uncharacterized protein n=1 Tax=marine sediment metagenome TaxID=412755 RepID=A0A0F9JFW7_9ZZZZ